MPYVKQEVRGQLDPEIAALVRKLDDLPGGFWASGNWNYVISRLLGYLLYLPALMKPESGPPDYNERQRIVGLIQCVKDEFVRQNVEGYEDEKKAQNGDVYEPDSFKL